MLYSRDLEQESVADLVGSVTWQSSSYRRVQMFPSAADNQNDPWNRRVRESCLRNPETTFINDKPHEHAS